MRKLITWKRVIVSFFILILVSIVYFSYVMSKAEVGIKEAEQITNSFVFHTAQNNYELTYEIMAEEVKNHVTYSDFKDSFSFPMGIYSNISDIEPASVNFTKYIGRPITIYYVANITFNDGLHGKLKSTIIQENGEWKMYGIWLYPEAAKLKKLSLQ